MKNYLSLYKKVNKELHSNDNIIIEQVALREYYRKQYCKEMVLACAWCQIESSISKKSFLRDKTSFCLLFTSLQNEIFVFI